MKVLAIWLLCSVPLILTVVDAVKAAASATGLAQTEPAVSLPEAQATPAILASIDETFSERLIRFSWFDLPSADDAAIPARPTAALECREIQEASDKILKLNRGLRAVVRGFENPQLRQRELESFAQAVPGSDADLNGLERLPVAGSIRLCVASVVKQRSAASAQMSLRETAQENYRKARNELSISSLDKIVSALDAIPSVELSDEDREQLRWARFWRFWLPAQPTRVPSDLEAMRTRRQVLEQLVSGAEDPASSPMKSDETRMVDACRAEIESLKTQIRFAEIKEAIQSGSPELWVSDAEVLLTSLSDSDAQVLLKLVRESVLKRIVSTEVPAARFEEAVTKSGELWVGTFELRNADKPKPYYNFVSTSGQKKTYCYLSAFEEARREPFAILAYKRLSEARTALQAAPQKRESWQALLNEVMSLQQGKERYLKLSMVEGLADSKLVLQSLDTLKLDELQVVCDEILSEDLWPRIERLLSNKR
jgi:hypothetical protein